MATSMLMRFRSLLVKFEASLLEMYSLMQPPGVHPALAAVPASNMNYQEETSTRHSLLDTLLGDSILWAVPKNRRSVEKRRSRRMQLRGHFEAAIPRRDIVCCLECGHWHERNRVCGNCYEKVKAETEAMRLSMNEDSRLYNAPQSEVVFIYPEDQNQRAKHEGKYIVEMEKPRPEWFSKSLLTKGHGRR